MHKSSLKRMKWFLDNYEQYFSYTNDKIKVLDVGSYDVNGTYKPLFDKKYYYYGADIEAGSNVDIILSDIYNWEDIKENSFDVVISGQAFEHIEFPWLSIKEMVRVVKPDGFICIIAPSSAREHRYPYDCYRYFQDGLPALTKWSGAELMHGSIAGVPDYFTDEDWDETSNDAMIVAKKKGIVEIANPPQLQDERRVFDFEYRYRYRFMLKWIKYIDSEKKIKDYLKNHNYNTVVVYGIDELTDLIINDIEKNNKKDIGDSVKIKCAMSYKKIMSTAGVPYCNVKEFDYNVDAIVIADPDYHKRIENHLEKFIAEKGKAKIPLINIETIVDELMDTE